MKVIVSLRHIKDVLCANVSNHLTLLVIGSLLARMKRGAPMKAQISREGPPIKRNLEAGTFWLRLNFVLFFFLAGCRVVSHNCKVGVFRPKLVNRKKNLQVVSLISCLFGAVLCISPVIVEWSYRHILRTFSEAVSCWWSVDRRQWKS